MIIGFELKLRRTVEHMNQKQFAEKLDVSRRQLCRIEKHKVNKPVSKWIEEQYLKLYHGERLVDKLKGGDE